MAGKKPAKKPAWWAKPRRIAVVVDNDSWILPYARDLVRWAQKNGDKAMLCRSHDEVTEGIAAFYIGCTKITPPDIIARNRYNLVVHESGLPHGRGFAPMSWQILAGKKKIPVCLIEAAAKADAGNIYYRDSIKLKGHELCAEWRGLQGRKTVELCQRFLEEKIPKTGKPQKGKTSTYKRRRPEDSRLDPKKTIASQFDLLRVVDNKRYPAFFEYRGHRYKVTIERDD